MLIVMIALWVVIPTFARQNMYGEGFAQFIMLYLIGAYFRKYPENFFTNKTTATILAIVCFALLLLSTVALDFLGTKISIFANRGGSFYSRTSLLVIGIAVALFSLALTAPTFSNRFINEVSTCTFGVYLIHEHFFMRDLIWDKIFHVADFFSSPWLFVYMIGVVCLVFIGCTLIEFIRKKTIAFHLSNLLYKLVLFFKSLFEKRKKSEEVSPFGNSSGNEM